MDKGIKEHANPIDKYLPKIGYSTVQIKTLLAEHNKIEHGHNKKPAQNENKQVYTDTAW